MAEASGWAGHMKERITLDTIGFGGKVLDPNHPMAVAVQYRESPPHPAVPGLQLRFCQAGSTHERRVREAQGRRRGRTHGRLHGGRHGSQTRRAPSTIAARGTPSRGSPDTAGNALPSTWPPPGRSLPASRSDRASTKYWPQEILQATPTLRRPRGRPGKSRNPGMMPHLRSLAAFQAPGALVPQRGLRSGTWSLHRTANMFPRLIVALAERSRVSVPSLTANTTTSSTWTGRALSRAVGVAPRVRVGRRWFNLLWLLPIGFVVLLVAVAVAKGLRGASVQRFIAPVPRHPRSARRRTTGSLLGAVAALLQPVLHDLHHPLGRADPVRSPAAVLDAALHPGQGLVSDPEAGAGRPAVDGQAGLDQPAGPGRAPGTSPLDRPGPLVASRRSTRSGCSTAWCSTCCCSRPAGGSAWCRPAGTCSRTRCRC